jgi:mannosyltransferase
MRRWRSGTTLAPWHWVGMLTVASLALRLWRIDFQSFWLDEAHTAFYINGQTPGVIFERFTRPGENGPVYYLLLLPWRELFGGGEASLRGFSVVAATLAVPVTWLAFRRLSAPREALLTTALVATAPYLTWYAQEAKMYALALLAGVTSLWLFVEALHHGGAWRWVAYGVAALVSIYVHFFALLSIGAHALAAAVMAWPDRRRLGAAWLTVGLVLTPILAWQAIAIGRDVAGSGATMSSGEMTLATRVGVLAYAYAMNVTPAPLPVVVFASVSAAMLGTMQAVGPAWVAARAAGVDTVWRAGLPVPARGPLALAVLAWSPFVAHALAMGALGAGLFADRYFVAVVPLLYGVAAIGFGAITDRSGLAGATLAVVLLTVGAWATAYQSTVPIKDDFRRAMALYRGGKGERDAVVPVPHILSYPVGYHSAPGLDVVVVDMERPPVDFAAKFDGRTGVWVITNVPDRYVPLHDLREWLAGHATLASDDTVTGGVGVQHWLLDGGCDAVPGADGAWEAPTFARPCVEGLRSTPELTVVRP